MAVASGIGGQTGIATESVFGTYVAATHFHEPLKCEIKKSKVVVQGGGLAAGRLVQPGARRVVTATAGTGSREEEFVNKKMGILLRHIFGGTVAPVQQAATAAYKQTHILADNVGQYVSIQNGVPDTAGTAQPYTGKGGKVTSAEFSCEQNDLLKLMTEWDFQAVSEAHTLAAASILTGIKPFHFGQMSVLIGTYASEASVSGVRKVSFKIERPQDTDRFYAGAAGVKANPILSDVVKLTGTLDVDFVDKTVFHDRFAADTSTSMILRWQGPLIASTYYEQLDIKLPLTFFDGDSPVLSDTGITKGSIPFTVQYDDVNAYAAVTAEYTSIDTTI